jgi:hypothetical protein
MRGCCLRCRFDSGSMFALIRLTYQQSARGVVGRESNISSTVHAHVLVVAS